MDRRIESLQRRCAADHRVISLGGGLPAPVLFPRRALAAAAARVLRRADDAALQYGWPEGGAELRGYIAAGLRARGVSDVSAEDVVITSGAQQAVAIAVEVLATPGARAWVEPESYPGALDILRARGVALVAGPDAPRARLAYAMPALSNPRGRVAGASARAALLTRARRDETYLVEDEAYADLCFAGPPGAPLLACARERVLLVGTFSKVLCPGLRVGWLVAPRALREEILEAKRIRDLQANGLAQWVLQDFLAHRPLARRLAHARRFYAARAAVLCDALRRELPEWRFDPPEGGFSVWLEGPEPGDDAALLEAAVAHGVGFDPGRLFVFDGAPRTLSMRVSYSLEPAERLEAGVSRLARAWRVFRRSARAA
jgi:2-aminoadipate transaminase